MTFINRMSAIDVTEDDLYVDWKGNKYRIDILEFIDTVEWDGDLVALARGICKNATFEVAIKYNDYLRRLRLLEGMGERLHGLPKRLVTAY